MRNLVLLLYLTLFRCAFGSSYEPQSYYPSPQGGRIVDKKWQSAYAMARSIVDSMSIIEKVNITTGIGLSAGKCSGNTGSVPRLGFQGFCIADSPTGIMSDLSTLFPAGITRASSFNSDLMYDMAAAMAAEYKKKGVHIINGPVLGPMGVKAAGGRGWEGFGPDSYLAGVSSAATVKGLQSENVVATAKHFILNEQEHFRSKFLGRYMLETNFSSTISSDIDDRGIHELYMWPFAEAVHSGLAAVMCSYNKINGSEACENSYVLNYLLKTELEFQGFVMSDWAAQTSGVNSAIGGLDMTMPGLPLSMPSFAFWGPHLTEMALNGTLPIQRLNDMATRILAASFFVGAELTREPNFSSNDNNKYGYEYPLYDEGSYGRINENVDVRNDKSYETALNAALEGLILLKNIQSSLPLNANNSMKNIAVLGNCGTSRGGSQCSTCYDGAIPVGYGSGAGLPSFFISPLDGLQEEALRRGIGIHSVPDSWDIDSAVGIAKSSDASVVFVTAHSGEELDIVDGNVGDRNNLTLWNNGNTLIEQVASVCNNTIVVVTAPGQVDLEPFIENQNVTAVLYSSYLGEYMGTAVSKILFGEVIPSAKLPYTIAKDVKDYIPVMYNTTVDMRDVFNTSIFVDYKLFEKNKIEPRFEFGYGLSYSNFTITPGAIIEVDKPSKFPPTAEAYLPVYSFEDTVNVSDCIYPEGFHKYKGVYYSYLNNTDDIYSDEGYKLPEEYSDAQRSSPPNSASGGPGGNPALWDLAYRIEGSLKNNGPYDGSYAVQLYVEFPQDLETPRQLRGFTKKYLRVSESELFHLDITRKDLSVWSTVDQTWLVQRGKYTFYMGYSSSDLIEVGSIYLE